MSVDSSISDRSSCPQCLAVFRGGFQRCPRDGAVLAVGEEDPLLGTVLAERYVIESLLGEGGIGRVYRARHVRMSRRFAIKVPFGELAYDSKVRDRFHNEAEAASRLQHPNVIGVVDVGESAAGLLYLAMDLAEGDNLAQVIHQGGPMPRDRVVRILRQMAEGLDHAHQRGLVHRDLKPENIILDDSDGSDRARIVDFGIAILRDENAKGRLTTQGIVLGTPHYMAPEQACDQPIDHRTDLFSLGLILYEMMAGVLPFDGSAIEVARKNLSATPPPIADRVSGLTVDRLLEALAFWLLEKQPADRPQSAAAVVEMVWLIETDPDAARVKLRLGELDDVDELGLAPVVTGLPGPRGAVARPSRPASQPVASPPGAEAPRTSRRAPSHLPPEELGGDLIAGAHHTDRMKPGRRGLWILIAFLLLALVAVLVVVKSGGTPSRQAAAAVIPDAGAPVAVAADAAIELAVADAAVAPSPPDAEVEEVAGKPPRHDTGKKPRPDAGVAVVRPRKVDAGVTAPEPPEPSEPPSEKTLTALYNQVGQKLNALVNAKGSSAAAGFKKRYLEIPYMEAIRKPALRIDAMKRLRALAKDLAAAQ